MEIKAELNKPYTDKERTHFISINNWQKGYEIKETDTALEAWGLTEEELLINKKTAKFAENDAKCNEKRYSQEFTVTLQEKECVFDTTNQTQADLQAAGLVTSTGATYDNWVTNNGVIINLTAEDVQVIFTSFFAIVSPLYQVQLKYKNEIEACTTLEEVEAIVIDYDKELQK